MIFSALTSPEIGALAPRSIALMPLAAIEQHGGHLGVNTDTALVTEIASRAERSFSENVLLLPTLWAGCSHHHLGFPGTLSISSEIYVCVLMDLAESLISSGFRRIILINGHGGNVTPMTEALYRLSIAHQNDADRPWIAATSYWRLTEGKWDFMESPKLTHACEFETSMMLALAPGSVRMEHAQGSRADRGSRYYDPLGYEPSRVTVCETFAQMTPHGAMGTPEQATAEKGERLLTAYTRALCGFLEEFSRWPMS